MGGTTGLGTLVVTCRGKTGESVHFHLRMTPGSGSYRQRVMQSGNEKLIYNLYLDASRSQVWGDGSASTREFADTVRLPGPVYSRLYPVYARILSSAAVEPKSYVDTVVIELDY
jgi:spore coat protein U-like protein